MASINITPLTDVLLVLLIIFMIAISAIQKERIEIPQAHFKDKALDTNLVLLIQQDKRMYVGAKEVAIPQLKPYLEKLAQNNALILKCHKDVPYGLVAKIMQIANHAGFHNISLATKTMEETKGSWY